MQRLREYTQKITSAMEKSDDLVIILIIVLVGFAGFGLGRLSGSPEKSEGVHIEYLERGGVGNVSATVESVRKAPIVLSGAVVVSKNSTKYHYPWCSGAQRIKEENKIWFNTIEEARASGYTPAANCKGLE